MKTPPLNVAESPLRMAFWKRVHNKNKDILACICGERGSGKSYICLSLAHSLDPTFLPAVLEDPASRIVYTSQDYSNAVLENLKKGSAVIFEEAGGEGGADHRKWQKVENDVVRYITQVQRHLNLFVFFNTPIFQYLDSDLRKLFSYYIEARDYDKRTKANFAYVFRLFQDSFTGKTFPIYPTIKNLKGQKVDLKQGYWFEGPPKELVKIYEKFSKKKKKDIEKNQTTKFDIQEEKEKEVDVIEIMEKVWLDPNTYKHPKGYWDKTKIELKFEIGNTYSRRVQTLLKIKEKEEIAKHQ